MEQKPTFVVTSDQKRLAYQEYGHKNGMPVFFFHGWPSSRLQARRYHEAASKARLRLISIDRPGYGYSDYIENRTLLGWASNIAEIADKLDINKFSVIGVSGGGPYAAACAYAMPKRLNKIGIIVGLSPTDISGVLQGMALPNKITWYLYHKIPLLMHVSSIIQFLRQKIIPNDSVGLFPSRAEKRLLNNGLQEELRQVRMEAYRQGIRGVTKDLKLYISDWGFELKNINKKVFLWYGADDKNVSIEMGKLYEKEIPDSILKIYLNTGHLLLDTHVKEIFTEFTKK